jgi:hypothetical protein
MSSYHMHYRDKVVCSQYAFSIVLVYFVYRKVKNICSVTLLNPSLSSHSSLIPMVIRFFNGAHTFKITLNLPEYNTFLCVRIYSSLS